MSKTIECKGSCLCGAVRLTAVVEAPKFGACHCGMCRKWGGGPFLTVGSANVDLQGADNIAIYNSSDWAERGFCKSCGSHLFYHLKNSPQYFLPLGLLEGTDKWTFEHQIFVDEKPAAYDFVNTTENMTGAEVFAKFAPPQ